MQCCDVHVRADALNPEVLWEERISFRDHSTPGADSLFLCFASPYCSLGLCSVSAFLPCCVRVFVFPSLWLLLLQMGVAEDLLAIDGDADLALVRNKTEIVRQVCELSMAFLEGTHPRLGRESPVIQLSAGRKSEAILTKICALIAHDDQEDYTSYIHKNGGNIHEYRFDKKIGAGTYGKVYRGVHKRTNFTVAIKTLDKARIKEKGMTEKVMRETHILKLLSVEGHPHVVRLFEFIETPTKFFMVMTHCPGGDFFDFLAYRGSVTEEEARVLFLQIMSGVEYCHFNNVVHRDLKPENLLIDANCNVQLADFSLANTVNVAVSNEGFDPDKLVTSCGSPNYAAPEIVSGIEYDGFQVDIWSLGVILYSLVCGMLPFDDDNPIFLFRQIKSGQYPDPPKSLSEDCRLLLKQMLTVDPHQRITIRKIRQHPWCVKAKGDLLGGKSILAYGNYLPNEGQLNSDESDEDIAALLTKDEKGSKGKRSVRSISGNSLEGEGPGTIEIWYRPAPAWKRTFLHHTIRGAENWMPLPGQPMEKSEHAKFPSPPWRYLSVHREKWGMTGFAFAFNDGSGGWDNNGSPFKNYHAQKPGQYWVDGTTGEVVSLTDRLPPA